MSILAQLAAFATGVLVGVNPYTAHQLRARLDATRSTRVLLEATACLVLVALLVGALAWTFAPFVSGRLTNALLLLGIFAMGGAVFAIRPVGRRREPPIPENGGWRWLRRYAMDAIYFVGPAWIVATLVAMRTTSIEAFAWPYVLAVAGAIAATSLWIRLVPEALPLQPPAPGKPAGRATILLAIEYGVAGAIMLAGNVKLI